MGPSDLELAAQQGDRGVQVQVAELLLAESSQMVWPWLILLTGLGLLCRVAGWAEQDDGARSWTARTHLDCARILFGPPRRSSLPAKVFCVEGPVMTILSTATPRHIHLRRCRRWTDIPPGKPSQPAGNRFTPGHLMGCASGELGLRRFLEDHGHTLIE